MLEAHILSHEHNTAACRCRTPLLLYNSLDQFSLHPRPGFLNKPSLKHSLRRRKTDPLTGAVVSAALLKSPENSPVYYIAHARICVKV